MKKYLFLLLLTLSMSLSAQDEPLRWSGDTLYVNTTTICPEIKGYNGATPVLISIYDGKIVRVNALPNHETRSYFRAINKLLMFKWDGQTVADGITLDVDAITGATASSNSVIGHVRAGLTEAQKVLESGTPESSSPLLPILCGIGSALLIAILCTSMAKKKKHKVN